MASNSLAHTIETKCHGKVPAQGCNHPSFGSDGPQRNKRKITESEPLCHSHGWLFTPLGWHPWGGVGPHGAAFLSRVEKTAFGDLRGWPRRNAVLHFRAQLVFQLMKFVAHQLRAHEDVCLEGCDADRSADHPPIENLEEERTEPARWDEPWDSDDDPMD